MSDFVGKEIYRKSQLALLIWRINDHSHHRSFKHLFPNDYTSFGDILTIIYRLAVKILFTISTFTAIAIIDRNTPCVQQDTNRQKETDRG